MRLPFFSKEALILAYILLLASLNGIISKVETKLSTIFQFFFLALLFSAPSFISRGAGSHSLEIF
jgi:hypothetical protein